MPEPDFPTHREVAKGVFDDLHKHNLITEGPFIESQPVCGGGYKDVVYQPDKRAYGETTFGPVWAWVRGSKVKREEKTDA